MLRMYYTVPTNVQKYTFLLICTKIISICVIIGLTLLISNELMGNFNEYGIQRKIDGINEGIIPNYTLLPKTPGKVK